MTYRVHDKKFNGYTVYEDNGQWYVDAPCGCFSCDDSVEHGHSMCSNVPDEMEKAEKRCEVVRSFEDRWVWVLTNKGVEAMYPSVFIKRVRNKGMVEFRIIKGEKGFGKILYTVNGWDNPKSVADMTDKLYKEIDEKSYSVAGTNYLEGI